MSENGSRAVSRAHLSKTNNMRILSQELRILGENYSTEGCTEIKQKVH